MRANSNRPRLPLARFAIVVMMVGGAACGRTDDRPAAWAYVSAALFQPSCATASCHSRARAVAGLDFSDPDRGYTSLTGLEVWVPDLDAHPDGGIGDGCQAVGDVVYCEFARPLVSAFNPTQSRLVNVLRARSAPRMPPDRPLSEADISLVETWILDGARKSPEGPPAGETPPSTDGGVDAAGGHGGRGGGAGGSGGMGGSVGPGGSGGGAGIGGHDGGRG